MKFTVKLKIIITKNYDQFLSYCRENNINPKDKFVRYVNREEQIRGLRNCEIIYYGEYWKNPLFGSYLLDVVNKS